MKLVDRSYILNNSKGKIMTPGDKKRVQIILYLISNLGNLTKLHLIKLIFFADKYYMLNFGKSITNDTHYAMPHGPVCSETLDIINQTPNYCQEKTELIKYFNTFFEKKGHNLNLKVKPSENDFKTLAKMEKKALDYIIENFKSKSTGTIVNYSHELAEWLKYTEPGTKKVIGSRPMNCLDLITQDPDNIISKNIDNEHIANIKNYIKGCY